MEIDKIEAAIEAVLFSVGDAVPLKKLAEALQLDLKTTKSVLNNMKELYLKENRGIQLIELDGSFQLCSKTEYYDLIKRIAVKVREVQLTDVLIETLSIIAYKQPITKPHIEAIRGVNSNHTVNKLVELKLVDEVGRMQAPGRPILFGTSNNFLRAFGLKSVDELPYIEDADLVRIKQSVFDETQIRLDDPMDDPMDEQVDEQVDELVDEQVDELVDDDREEETIIGHSEEGKT
ncbi:MAG: SMC-Scp complex subunit ScpB [Vallitaleaceae bacterium]|jgi:segregation and condensation protein B|nr:SMC-Scp complex subunit ScpB [Vallitaleaceae bacterium]